MEFEQGHVELFGVVWQRIAGRKSVERLPNNSTYCQVFTSFSCGATRQRSHFWNGTWARWSAVVLKDRRCGGTLQAAAVAVSQSKTWMDTQLFYSA